MDWHPEFIERSPMLEPLRAAAVRLRAHAQWPRREDLQEFLAERPIVTGGGARLRLAAPSGGSEPYESRIYLHGEMQFREGEWHDLFNLLAWLAYPRTKAALNEAHHLESLRVPEAESSNEGSNRSRLRDALTVFDESGAIAVSSDADLLDDLQAFRWKQLFRERRDRVRARMRVHLFGHALFEKALHPYVGMTAHALLLPISHELITAPAERLLEAVDAAAAGRVCAMTTPQALSPLPLLGVPGWWPDNAAAAFYDDDRHFRPGRTRAPP
jgi:hypothetical protein